MPHGETFKRRFPQKATHDPVMTVAVRNASCAASAREGIMEYLETKMGGFSI